jgi:hypothetical protein
MRHPDEDQEICGRYSEIQAMRFEDWEMHEEWKNVLWDKENVGICGKDTEDPGSTGRFKEITGDSMI